MKCKALAIAPSPVLISGLGCLAFEVSGGAGVYKVNEAATPASVLWRMEVELAGLRQDRPPPVAA
jgi:hypothetical protein